METKRTEYLACGVWLVLIVNYEKRSAEAYDYSPMMFPDLQLPMPELFAELDIPEV